MLAQAIRSTIEVIEKSSRSGVRESLGWLTTRSAVYQTVNLVGSLILTAVALNGRLYGFVILNGVWAVVSLIALARIILRREKAA